MKELGPFLAHLGLRVARAHCPRVAGVQTAPSRHVALQQSCMSSHAGVILGSDTFARATALAGCLAEMGVARLLLRVGPERRWLEARGTNLPGEIARAVDGAQGVVEVDAGSVGAVFEFTREGTAWKCGDAEVAQRLRARLHM